MFKQIARYLLQALCGATLIYWGYKNLYSIELFEYRLVEQYIGNWYVAPVIARLVVSLKFMVGAFFILNLNPKNILPKLSLLLMGLHLFDLIWGATASNIVVFKSYTDIIRYNTTLSIAAMVYITAVSIYMLIQPKSTDIRFKWVKYPIGLTLIVLPFILNAIFPENLTDVSTKEDTAFDMSLIENETFHQLASDSVIVGYFSTNCPFCLLAAQKVSVSQKRWGDAFPKFFICFLGDEEGAKNFMDFLHYDLPYQVLSREAYVKLSDGRFPKFAWVENGVIKKRWDGRTFNYYTMKQFCED